MRPAFKWAVVAVGFVCLALLFWHLFGKSPAPSVPTSPDDATVAGEDAIESRPPETAAPAGPRKTAAIRAQGATHATTLADASAANRLLVASICEFDQRTNAITGASAKAWKQQLQELVQQGPAAIPAIREFMSKNNDIGFSPEGAKLAGYPSVRAAFIDALGQIGGAEGLAASLEILQSTAEPREIGLLARNLESIAPGQYRDQILASARQSLEMAGSGQLQGYDVAPVFEILQRYGGADAIPELQKATGQWKYYSTMALAQMPDGAGIPALISMTMNAPPVSPLAPRDAALEMLAQVAIQYPEARQALISQVQSNRVPPASWTFLFSILGGDQAQMRGAVVGAQLIPLDDTQERTTHLTRGNQSLVYAPPVGGYSPDQLTQQLALVDELRSATSDPNALNVLQQARMRLEQRLSQLGVGTRR